MKKIFILIFIIFNIFTFTNAEIVKCETSPCSWQDFSNTLINLIRTIVIISFWITVLLSTIGAFLLMFHGPYPHLYKRGWSLIQTAIFGYILILLSGVFFDFILEFFTPKLALASNSTSTLTITTYFNPLKNAVTEGLKCGRGATSALDRIFNCIFEAIGLLKNLAIILLTISIIGSAAYLITTPLSGLKNITKAYQILIWSVIGLVVILLADVIKAQIERLTK